MIALSPSLLFIKFMVLQRVRPDWVTFTSLFTTSTTWEASVGLGMKKFHSLSCFSPHAKRKLNVEEKFWILSLMETVALSQYTDVRCFCCVWPVFMAINYVGWSTESQVQRRKWLVVFGEKESAIHFSLFFPLRFLEKMYNYIE